MIEETLLEAEEKMEKAVVVAKEDFAAIRTGRAHPAMFNKIVADYYGALTPINQLASFSVPEPRMAVVTPFDKSALRNIEQAIRDSDLGVNPSNDGNIIRVVFPRADRGAPQGVHQGRQDQGRGRQDLDPQRPPQGQGDHRQARSRTARSARTRAAARRRSSTTPPRSTSRRWTSCSSTRKPSCSRSDERLFLGGPAERRYSGAAPGTCRGLPRRVPHTMRMTRQQTRPMPIVPDFPTQAETPKTADRDQGDATGGPLAPGGPLFRDEHAAGAHARPRPPASDAAAEEAARAVICGPR